MELPNEMWYQILIRLRYIDVYTFSCVSKRFHLLCLLYQRYRKRLSDVIHSCLKEISRNIFAPYNEVFKSRKYLRSVIDMKMKNIAYQLLPFKIREHLFSCQRGVVNVGECNLCTRFFIESFEEIYLVDYATHLYSFNCSSFEVFSLFELRLRRPMFGLMFTIKLAIS